MESRPAALLVAPESPYPAVGGGALHSAAVVEYLARRYEVDVIVFHEPGARDPAAAFPPGLVRQVQVVELPFHARSRSARAARNLERFLRGAPPLNDRFAGFGGQIADFLEGRRYRVGVVEHFWCAPYWEQVAPHCEMTVLDLIDVESVLYKGYAETEGWPASVLFRRFHRACLEMEKRWLPRYSLLLATSPEDAARVREIAPGSRIEVYPNTVPLVSRPPKTEEDVIIFSGNLEYQPNSAAVRYFRSEIWPVLRDRWPRLTWRLIGKNPRSVERYAGGDSRIDLRGPVEDAIGALAAAKVSVAPLLGGSGTRVKILEAWAAGTAVVSTRIGAEGLGASDGEHLLIADSPRAFADAVSSLLDSAALRGRIGASGRLRCEMDYTWEAGWARLRDIGI